MSKSIAILVIAATLLVGCESTNSPESKGTKKHEYVDLGLSVKWATCNVGANLSKEYGDYFSWGETSVKEIYGVWTTYKWCEGSKTTLTKYNTTDNITILDKSDDATTVNWGGDWRTPTIEEWNELYTSCTWAPSVNDEVLGFTVTSPNGNSIFLPAAGYMYGSDLEDAVITGNYWSSSLNLDNPQYAHGVYFYTSREKVEEGYSNRCSGLSIRPVCP